MTKPPNPERVPFGEDAPVFREPWEAQAFALVVSLHARGLFSWLEWTEVFGAQLRLASSTDSRDDYYRHWLAALETLVVARGLISHEELRSPRCQGM